MSPTVPSVLMLSLLLALSLPAAEAGEIADLFALIRNTLKFWRRIYQMYEEEVTLGYCWAEYLVRRGRDARNTTDLESIVPLENDSLEKEQWNHWVFAVQRHGPRAKRSYARVSENTESGEKDDAKFARKDERSTSISRNIGAWDDDLVADFPRSSSCSCNEFISMVKTGTRNAQVREYERFLRNLARRGGRSTEIPSTTDIAGISKIVPDALASSTRPCGSNKTKFKLNELRSWRGSKDTQDDYSRSLASETLDLVSSPNVEKLRENSWKRKPMGELRRVKNGESIFHPIVARVLSSSEFFPTRTRRELLFFGSFPVGRSNERRFDLEFENVQRGKRDANDRTGRASLYNSVGELPESSRKHGVEILSGGTMIRYSKRHRDASSVKQVPVIDGVSKFRASSSGRNYVIESALSTGYEGRERAKNQRGRNNSKQSSLASIDNRFVGKDRVLDYGNRSWRKHHMLPHLQQVFTAFLTTLGFFVNVGRQLMDYVDSNSALACTKDYILGKAVHWIDS